MALIDLNKLATETLELFGGDDRSEAVQNFARRKYLSKLSEMREQREIFEKINVQQQLEQLDYLILTLYIPTALENHSSYDQPIPPGVPGKTTDVESLKILARTVFHAPTDGSRKRARVLSQRAIQLVNEEIKKSDIGFFERRKLRKSIKKFINELAETIVKVSE